MGTCTRIRRSRDRGWRKPQRCRYNHGDAASTYEVLAIERAPRPLGTWPVWDITVRYGQDGRETTHCTGWDARRDTVVAQPPPA